MKNKEKDIEILESIASEIEHIAKEVAEDFKNNPAEEEASGSVIHVHEESPYLDENLPDKKWKYVIKNI